jgi:hypothetical protein
MNALLIDLVISLLEILRLENLKNTQNSSIIYIESERDVTPTSK